MLWQRHYKDWLKISSCYLRTLNVSSLIEKEENIELTSFKELTLIILNSPQCTITRLSNSLLLTFFQFI